MEQSKAQIFKEKKGYSLTSKKLMDRYGCKTFEEYKIKRAELKKSRATKKTQ